MARTRASVAAKVATGKSSKARCSAAPPPSNAVSLSSGSSSEKSSRSYSGGNPVCPRETPKWQKPITNFFIQNQETGSPKNDDEVSGAKAGSSKLKPKRNIIHSDDEEDTPEKPKNSELDESIELEPLNGEDSHKINEYYNTKHKGIGKKSNKENININITNKKRQINQLDSSSEDIEQNNKKIKVD